MRLNWKSPWRGAAFLFCLPNPRKVRDVANAEELLEWDRGCGPSSLPSHFLHYLQLPRVTSLAEAQLKFRVGTRVLLWHAQLRKQQHGTHRGASCCGFTSEFREWPDGDAEISFRHVLDSLLDIVSKSRPCVGRAQGSV